MYVKNVLNLRESHAVFMKGMSWNHSSLTFEEQSNWLCDSHTLLA